MDSQGILKPEHGSASVRAKSRQRRTSGGQVVINSDDDSWVKNSPAYLQLQERYICRNQMEPLSLQTPFGQGVLIKEVSSFQT